MQCAFKEADRRVGFIKRVVSMGLLGAVLSFSGAIGAQGFPNKPVRIVVPAVAGGNLDIVTRNVAQKLAEQLGQPVVVENRPGGNYKVGVDIVAKAPADGYTYLAVADSFLYAPLIVSTKTYDPNDFVGVSVIAQIPQILVAHPSVAATSVQELIAWGKGHPGELTYGSTGTGATGHIAAELFAMQAGISMMHVPYKGNAPALSDLMGGRLSIMFDTLSTSMPQVKAGTLKALGMASAKRSPLLPAVPTISEAGLPGYEASIFNGFVAMAGTPPAILQRMHAEIRKVLQQQDFRTSMLERGVELASSDSPEQFTEFMKRQSDKYARVVKSANIRAE